MEFARSVGLVGMAAALLIGGCSSGDSSGGGRSGSGGGGGGGSTSAITATGTSAAGTTTTTSSSSSGTGGSACTSCADLAGGKGTPADLCTTGSPSSATIYATLQICIFRRALSDARGNQSQAARALGTGHATLSDKIKKHGLGDP